MLISDTGAQALDKVGARRAAELVRRTNSDLEEGRDERIREIVLNAMLELDVLGFIVAMNTTKDPEAIYQAFYIFHEAKHPPTVESVVRSAVDVVALPGDGSLPRERMLRRSISLILTPWGLRRRRYMRLIARRNKSYVRRELMNSFLALKDKRMIARARISRDMFTRSEYDRLENARRVGHEAA